VSGCRGGNPDPPDYRLLSHHARYHTEWHPGSRQAIVKCPQMASSGCSVWPPGHEHGFHVTSARLGPHLCPFRHRFG
jgi:hypothetical protein